jgi:hypothetical protein
LLFIAGSLDVDSAIVTLGGLPSGSVDPAIAAISLGGTVAVNMAFKIAIVLANGRLPATSLLASLVILISTLVWRLIELAP